MSTYPEFALCNQRRAGQFWRDGSTDGQWAWNPVSDAEYHVAWGTPDNWPPRYVEHFIRDGDWLYCHGWEDNGTYYTIKTTGEWLANPDGTNLRTIDPHPSGMQHYVQWNIPSAAYRVGTQGTITEECSGKVITFYHRQIWYPPADVSSNPYMSARACIRQYELWRDDAPKRDGVLTTKVERNNYIGLGAGPAYVILPKNDIRADLRYAWSW